MSDNNLTGEQITLLHHIDTYGFIPEDFRSVLPGVHFCPDWDGLPICDDSPEKEACTCPLIKTQS